MKTQLKNLLVNYIGKNIMVSVENQVTSSDLMTEFDARFVGDSIFMDGKNTIASSLHFPLDKITKIDTESENSINICFKGGTNVRLSITESDSKIWTRAVMNRNWEKGRMYLY